MATDQEIRNQGFKYIPQQQYLLNPFELQTTQTENPGGIISTNAAMPYMGYPSYEAWLAAQRGGGDGGGQDDDDTPTTTGTFDWSNFPSLINIARRVGTWGVDKFKDWQNTRAANKESDLMDDIGAHNFEAASKINPDILSPNNPLIGKIDHTGGGITRDPGSVVEGAPTHSKRDDLMATGGIVGLAQGGRIGFKDGAQFDTSLGGGDISPGTSTTGEFRGGDGPTISGDDNIVIPPKDNFTVDTDLISKEPSMEAMYTPAEWANIKARIFNKDVTSEDDINFALSGEIGPVRADMDTSKDLRNISFNQDLGNFNLSGNTDLNNYNLGIDYNKGPFFAGATTDNMGNTNFNVGAKWSWGGEPEQTYNTLSYKDQNPDLIYGQNLRYGGLASIL